MARRAYISCDYPERELAEVRRLCTFLQSAGCVLTFAPQPGGDLYAAVEEAIEQCDAFVAAVGEGYHTSTWLNHELAYAYGLSRLRLHSRPRLFGLALGKASLPNCSKHIPLEWLHSDADYRRVLQALLPRE